MLYSLLHAASSQPDLDGCLGIPLSAVAADLIHAYDEATTLTPLYYEDIRLEAVVTPRAFEFLATTRTILRPSYYDLDIAVTGFRDVDPGSPVSVALRRVNDLITELRHAG